MSTYISGFILKEGTDVFALSRKARETFLPLLQKMLYQEFLEHFVTEYDMATYSPETRQVFRTSHDREAGELSFYHVMIEARKEQQSSVDNTPDHYQVQLGFAPDPLTGRILCAWFGSRENREIFSDFSEVEDFSYWNSSEGPEDISDEDWEARIKAWDRTLLPSSHVSSSTLMSKVAAPHELSLNVSWDGIEESGASFPSRDWRVKKLSQHFISQEWIKEQDDPFPNFSLSGMMAALRDETRIQKWTKTVSENLDPKDLDFDTVRQWSSEGKVISL